MAPYSISAERPIGLAPLGFLDLTPSQLIRVAANAGFSSVGLRTQAAVAGGAEHPFTEGSLEFNDIRTAIVETGIVVDFIEVVSLHRQVQIAGLKPMLHSTSAIGATRILCTGDDEDLSVVAEKFAELCDLGAAMKMSTHLEFMRFRAGVRTLAHAMEVLSQAHRPNGFLALDILHLIRSEGGLQSLRYVPLDRIGIVQMCDGPLMSPADEDLTNEARHNRLPPGEGQFPIKEFLHLIPAQIGLHVEAPLSGERTGWTHARRAALLYSAMHSQLI